MNTLTYILKEALNDAQKKALAKTYTDRVDFIITHYKHGPSNKEINVRKSGDNYFLEVHFNDLDVFLHTDKSNTDAKFISKSDVNKLPYIMIYNAEIDVHKDGIAVRFNKDALYDEVLKFLDQRNKKINEASLSSDTSKSQEAKKFIDKIKNLINSYKSDNKEIKVKGIGSYSYIEINLGNLDVNILPTDKGATKAQFEPSTNGSKPKINVYGSAIKREPKLSADIDEKDLYHELIHYLDFKNIKTDPKTLDKSYQKQKDKKGYSGYINNPLEVNAHFFEFFMPEVIKFIEKEKEIPGTFDEFKNGLLSNHKAKEFIDDLDEKNKKKILKRLGTYYNNILKNPEFKIEKDDEIDDQQLKKATSGFISKLKSILHIK